MTILGDLVGSRSAEAALLHLFHHGESYGRAIAADMGVSLDSVQRQLDKFEKAGILVSTRQGRTLVYGWNPKSRFATRLKDLVSVVYEGIPLDVTGRIFPTRRRPRAKDKPVISKSGG